MRVEWADSARRDFDAAIDYLLAHSPAGARRVGQRILDAVGLLERFPELAAPSRHRGLRQLAVPRTPYLVIYRVHQDRVEIRAVVHGRRKRRK